MKSMTQFRTLLAVPALVAPFALLALVGCAQTQDIQNLTLSAKPDLIEYGQESTLTWTADGAEGIQIDNGVGVVTGKPSVTVKPSVTTTYTLTATKGMKSQTLTAQVRVKPGILKLEAAPASITAGQKTVLSWETVGAKSVTLDGQTVESQGSLDVSPAQTTTYKLTATNDAGTLEKSVSVVVVPSTQKPVIKGFKSNKPTYTEGDDIVLTWTAENATQLMLMSMEMGNTNVTGLQSYTLKNAAAGKYSFALAAYPVLPETGKPLLSDVLLLTVSAPQTSIEGFRSSTTTLVAGESATLSWATSNATKLTLNDGAQDQDVTGKTEFLVKPKVTTTYTLVAERGQQKPSKQLTLQVMSFKIDYFKSDKTAIQTGEKALLSWNIRGDHDKALLHDGSQDIDVTGKTSLEVTPEKSTTYKLTVQKGQEISSQTLKITFGGLSYTDPTSGSFRLMKNASLSSGDHLVLDLVNGASEATRGVGFYLQIDPEMAAWAPLSDTDGALVQFVALDPTQQGRPLLIGKADKGLLQIGIFQKGAGLALQGGPDVVLARIALTPQGAKSGPVALSALKGKAVSLQANASLKAIEISLGQLERK